MKGNPISSGQGFEQWPPEGTTPTGGWLLTNWNQNAPYNNFCPLDLVNGGRSVAGCPAVAMAQILNYHNTTMDVQFTIAMTIIITMLVTTIGSIMTM